MGLLPPDDENPLHGARPGRAGRFLESRVEAGFGEFGVRTVHDNREYHGKDIFERTEKFLVRQPLIRGVKLDFLYIDFRRKLRLPIECKQQTVAGSTDRKLDYAVNDLISVSHGMSYGYFWLIVSGDGFSPKVMQKVQNKITTNNDTRNGKKAYGRLVSDPLLFRAIQKLVEKGEAL